MRRQRKSVRHSLRSGRRKRTAASLRSFPSGITERVSQTESETGFTSFRRRREASGP